MPEKRSWGPRFPKRVEMKGESKRGRIWWTLLGLAIVLIGGGLLYVQNQLEPPNTSGTATKVEIPAGASAYDIGVQLNQKGLIKSPRLFKWYLAYQGSGAQLKAGTYVLKQGQTMEAIISALKSGDAKLGTVKFTIPEGLTIEQMADVLAKDKLVDKAAFLKEADTGTFDYPFLKEVPTAGVKHRLEGFLFPDTYEVFKDSDAHHIIDVMLKQTNAVFTPEMQAQMQKNGMNMLQTLTVASLVEREAKVDKERPIIAGVIYNRLHAKPSMDLQIDATVQYALGQTKEKLLYSDLDVDSPYNTYRHEGLPPGPIAAPGLPSIEAAVNPAVHDFYFYVTKNDGSGEHLFSKTYEEHEQNVAKTQG